MSRLFLLFLGQISRFQVNLFGYQASQILGIFEYKLQITYLSTLGNICYPIYKNCTLSPILEFVFKLYSFSVLQLLII